MTLPKFEYSIIDIELKSQKKKVKFRPILVKDEKLLLIAKEGQNDTDIFTAVKQVVTNCLLDDKVNIDKLPLFELEYIFLVLRMQSINNYVELSYTDTEDKKDYKFQVNLEDIKIKYPNEKIDNKIVSEETKQTIGLVMRYPPASLYSNKEFLNAKETTTSADEIIYESIVSIFDNDKVYEASEYRKEELLDWVNSLDTKTYRKIQEFLESTPYMEHIITYKNTNGTERTIALRTLSDFFIL